MVEFLKKLAILNKGDPLDRDYLKVSARMPGPARSHIQLDSAEPLKFPSASRSSRVTVP